MSKIGIDKRLYRLTVMPPESVKRLSNADTDSTTHLTREELEVYNMMGQGRTAKSIAEAAGMSSYSVMAALWRLEQKGVAERGYAETKRTAVDPASGKNKTTTRREEYFMQAKDLGMSGQIFTNETKFEDKDDNVLADEPFDFTKLSDEALRVLIPHPRYGNFAKKLLENRHEQRQQTGFTKP